MYLAGPALLIGLGLGIWLKSWRLVVVLIIVGVAIAFAGWQAAWFADEDTPALGGALVFELFIGAPAALGAGLGVYVGRAGGRSPRDDSSTLPVVGPPPTHPH